MGFNSGFKGLNYK